MQPPSREEEVETFGGNDCRKCDHKDGKWCHKRHMVIGYDDVGYCGGDFSDKETAESKRIESKGW